MALPFLPYREPEILTKNHISCAVYDQAKPNPTVDNVTEVLALFHEHHCDTLISTIQKQTE